MFRYAILKAVFILLLCAPAFAEDKADRLELVRRTYRPVPADVLRLSEPVRLVYADFLFDSGRTRFVIFEDARGKRLHATLDGEKDKTFVAAPEHYRSELLLVGDGGSVNSGRRVLMRGPAESAVYALLIRWLENPVVPEGNNAEMSAYIRANAEFFLRALDHRYDQPAR